MKELKIIGISTIISSILISCTHMSKKNMHHITQYNHNLVQAGPSIPILWSNPCELQQDTMLMPRVRRSNNNYNNYCDKQAIMKKLKFFIDRSKKLQSMRDAINSYKEDYAWIAKKNKIGSFKQSELDIIMKDLTWIFASAEYIGTGHLLKKIELDLDRNQCSLSPETVASFIDAFCYLPENQNLDRNVEDVLNNFIKRISPEELNDKVGVYKDSFLTWLIASKFMYGHDYNTRFLKKLVEYHGDKIKVRDYNNKEFNKIWEFLDKMSDNEFDTILQILSSNSNMRDEIRMCHEPVFTPKSDGLPIKKYKIDKILSKFFGSEYRRRC